MPNVETQQKDTYVPWQKKPLPCDPVLRPVSSSQPPVGFALASIYSEMGDKDEARTILREADETTVSDPRFLVKKWALHFELGDARDAQWENSSMEINLLRLILQLSPLKWQSRLYPIFAILRHRSLCREGRWRQACQKMSSCVSERPPCGRVQACPRRRIRSLENNGDALAQYEKALKLSC